MNQDPNITDAGGSPKETPEQIQTRLRTHADNYWTLRNKLILITTAISTMGLLVSLFSLIVAISFAFKQHNLREHDLRTQQGLREKDLSKQQELREQDFDRAWSLKEIDMRQYCQKRYDDLAYDTKAKVKTDNDAKGYYKRFWDLQFEQYQYCKDRVIDKQIFATWMASRRREYNDNELVGRMHYQKGWNYMADRFTKNDHGNEGAYTEFVTFMNEVFTGKKTTCEPSPKQP